LLPPMAVRSEQVGGLLLFRSAFPQIDRFLAQGLPLLPYPLSRQLPHPLLRQATWSG